MKFWEIPDLFTLIILRSKEDFLEQHCVRLPPHFPLCLSVTVSLVLVRGQAVRAVHSGQRSDSDSFPEVIRLRPAIDSFHFSTPSPSKSESLFSIQSPSSIPARPTIRPPPAHRPPRSPLRHSLNPTPTPFHARRYPPPLPSP